MYMTGSGGGVGLTLSTFEQLPIVAVEGFVVYQGNLAGSVGLYEVEELRFAFIGGEGLIIDGENARLTIGAAYHWLRDDLGGLLRISTAAVSASLAGVIEWRTVEVLPYLSAVATAATATENIFGTQVLLATLSEG